MYLNTKSIYSTHNYLYIEMGVALTLSTTDSSPDFSTSLITLPALLAATTLAERSRSIRGEDIAHCDPIKA